MSPDNRFFRGLRDDVAAKAAKEMREAEAARKRREAESVIEARKLADREERFERAYAAMNESDFPALIEELKVLHGAAETDWPGWDGLMKIHRMEVPSGSHKSERSLGGNMEKVDWYSWEFPFKPTEESDFIVVDWIPKNWRGRREELKRGFAVEALPDRSIVLVGSGRQILSERQWRGNPDAQGHALERAYEHPFVAKVSNRNRFTQSTEHRGPHDGF